jgi:hypothetical protein
MALFFVLLQTNFNQFHVYEPEANTDQGKNYTIMGKSRQHNFFLKKENKHYASFFFV